MKHRHRLDRLQAEIEAGSHILILENGESHLLPQGSAIRMVMIVAGIEPTTAPDSKQIELYARSQPRGAEGELDRYVRWWCRKRLGMSTDGLELPSIMLGDEEAWANGEDTHAALLAYSESEAT